MTSAGGDFPPSSSPFTASYFVSLALSPALYFSRCPGEPSAIIATQYYAVSKSGSFNKTAIHSVKNKLPCSRVCWFVAVSSLPPLPGASRHGPRFRGQGISGTICGIAYKYISIASASPWTSGLKKTWMPKASSQHCGCDYKPMISFNYLLDQSFTESSIPGHAYKCCTCT
ncbi:hypothetical protein J3F84DRAFT_128065 [Trichoderma pleuroticola]